MKRLLLVALAISGILASACFVRYGALYTENDTSHFVGFATNLSQVDVVSASVQVDFYNSNNVIIDTEFVSPCTRTLQIGMDSPIEVDALNGIVADHVQTTVRPLTFGHKTTANLNTYNIGVATDSGLTHIIGVVHADEDLDAVHVCAALLKSDGTVVKVGQQALGTLHDGNALTFNVTMEAAAASRFELWFDGLRGSDPAAPVVVGPSDISQFAGDTGPLSPTHAAVAGDFTNADRGLSDDGQFATATTTTADPDKQHVYQGYFANFALPSGAKITGIAVLADLKVSSTAGVPTISIALSWDGGLTYTAPPLSAPITSTSETMITLGGPTANWGNSDWTVDELSNGKFSVMVRFSGPNGTIFSLDWLPVIIYYEED
jgi:hypothetical protein